MARRTRVLYVENDPALRGILAKELQGRPEIDLIAAVGSSQEALELETIRTCDAALLDLALGAGSLNGHELGVALRLRNENIGIVIYSQHVAPDFLESLAEEHRWGWSFIEKSGSTDIDVIIDVLCSTARGLSVIDPNIQQARYDAPRSATADLTPRQRQIMSLAATGLDAPAIAKEIGVAAITVRKDLSKVYAILVPNPTPGTDLRVSAVLRYLQITRSTIGDADDY